jgi:hypothetical protein
LFQFLPALQDAGNRIAFPSVFELSYYIKKEETREEERTFCV